MGSKHPMSLRLKTKQNWSNTSYNFYSRNGLHEFFGLDKIALNVIKHYFQFALISKPKFNKDSNKIVISFYYFLNLPVSKRLNPYGQSKRIQSSLQEGFTPLKAIKFSSLILKLSNLYGKQVEIRPVRIHYPYLNSYILAQYISLNIKAGRFNKIMRILFNKAKLVENNNSTSIQFRDLIKYTSLINRPQYLMGIKIQISGRLSQRKAASRTRVVRKSSGTLRLGSFTSLIDASKFNFTGKNGAVTVKVWLSSSIENPLVNNSSVKSTTLINTPPLLQTYNSFNLRGFLTQEVRCYSSNNHNSINNKNIILPPP
jgi:ribosomal protein S3